MEEKYTKAISQRYNELSGEECCLSCGGAINFTEIKPGYKCIDLGSGKGYDVLKMATMAQEDGFAWGVDVSDKMMEIARENAIKLKLHNVTDFVKSPLEQISLPDACAHVVLSNCTINHSLEQSKVWKEIYRLLKLNGHFVVSDIYALEPISDEYRNDPKSVAECWGGAILKAEYMQNIRNAGFERFELIEESSPYEKGKVKVCSFTVKGYK